jgi:hypothetical protein
MRGKQTGKEVEEANSGKYIELSNKKTVRRNHY